MQWVRLLHQRSSRKKGSWINLKQKKKNTRQKLEWLLPNPARDHDLGLGSRQAERKVRAIRAREGEVATPFGVAT